MSSQEGDELERKKTEQALALRQQREDADRRAASTADAERIDAARTEGDQTRSVNEQQAQAAAMHQKQQALETKQLQEKEQKRLQDEMQQNPVNVVYSPEGNVPKPEPAPGAAPRPEPEYIKKFMASLDEETKKSVQYDEKSGSLIFKGPKALDALEKFVQQNPTAKFEGRFRENFSDEELASEFKELKNRGILDNLAQIRIGDKVIKGDELKAKIDQLIPSSQAAKP